MCGITGFVAKNDKNTNKILSDMMKKIKHRGPDDEGKYIDDNIEELKQ